LKSVLSGLPVNALRYYDRIDSTNTEASKWVDEGASDFSLVIAEEQTSGRGRYNRKWFTTSGASLTFSLILRYFDLNPTSDSTWSNSMDIITRITSLGSLAVSQALKEDFDLDAQIKWPNDVLLNGKKTAGILVEALWMGDYLTAVILGIGINVAPESVPKNDVLDFPATCIETVLGRGVSRLKLLRSVLEKILNWRDHLGQPKFILAWENRLAFRNQWIDIIESKLNEAGVTQGLVLGLNKSGGLRLRGRNGQEFSLNSGEVRLRPLPDL